MNLRTTAAAVLAVLALAVTGCSGGGSDERPKEPSSSAAASPSVDVEAARQACKDAWTKYVAGAERPDEKRARAACADVPKDEVAGIGAEALQEHTQKGRDALEECIDNPDAPQCPELP